ncbi:MAG: 6-phosphofructokinase, partial [Spirochaetes bacterium]|nr:6-phosphofructokinase [Spirochaetota bacterium]
GDSPGMNACVRSVVRTAIYHGNRVFGIKRGYQGMIDNDIEEMHLDSVGGIIKLGGTILYTARCREFLKKEGREKAFKSLKKNKIDSLIVIGGDGSFRGLYDFINEFSIQGIGVPGTIDNDLYGTDYTIGFDTAVNTALEAIDRIRDTAQSHNRLFLIEVMGRHSGYIAVYTGIGGGAEDILIPETLTDIKGLTEKLKKGHKRGKKSSIVIVAEGDEAGNAFEIKKKIEKLVNWEIRVSVIGHVQRGGNPTALDRLLASRMGYESVLAIMKGQSGKMLGIVNDQVNLVLLKDTWTKKKKIHPSYIKLAEILAT